MFLSSSTIIAKIDDNLLKEKELRNFHFFEQNNHDKNKKFYSINFFNNDMGEIHWSNSFDHGLMNVIGFIKKSNLFFLFTSSIQHHTFLKIILSKFYGKSVTISIIKLPFPVPNNIKLNIEKFELIDNDVIMGLVGVVHHNGKSILLKVYTNGVVTYSLTDKKEDIYLILDISLKILSEYGALKNV
ncbi:hypothetical protein [Halalkalibacter oceani]|uniref:hypothetical protein n=1 Tax=Halalkalibacter oceani TaxID=1653776 RepID=UPI00339387E2